MMLYNYEVKNIKGEEVSLEKYKGKVLLIVNTATGCGFTPQYDGLQALYNQYKEQGFEVLDFPSNQFFEQAPGTNEEISSFCKMNFGTTFETFAKINVNGEDAHPLYQYLKKEAPEALDDVASKWFYDKLAEMGFKSEGEEIKWNFTKFLVDREGKVVARFAPTCPPEKLEESIKGLL